MQSKLALRVSAYRLPILLQTKIPIPLTLLPAKAMLMKQVKQKWDER